MGACGLQEEEEGFLEDIREGGNPRVLVPSSPSWGRRLHLQKHNCEWCRPPLRPSPEKDLKTEAARPRLQAYVSVCVCVCVCVGVCGNAGLLRQLPGVAAPGRIKAVFPKCLVAVQSAPWVRRLCGWLGQQALVGIGSGSSPFSVRLGDSEQLASFPGL